MNKNIKAFKNKDMGVLTTIEVFGRMHVLKPARIRYSGLRNPSKDKSNYRGTGCALCGVMEKGESLTTFVERVNKLRVDKL